MGPFTPMRFPSRATAQRQAMVRSSIRALPRAPMARSTRAAKPMSRTGRATQPIRAARSLRRGRSGGVRGRRFGMLHGSEEDGLLGAFSEPVVLYGILPMGIAVLAGLWMAAH